MYLFCLLSSITDVFNPSPLRMSHSNFLVKDDSSEASIRSYN
uniref:Uncharacterized protein n=1 Tax=Rhizophora mucronata TaxID=61149 RepID=A0A2P2QDI9_RHIMU